MFAPHLRALGWATSRTFEPIGLRLFDRVERRNIKGTFEWLLETQEWPRAEIERLQDEQLKRLFEHAHRHSPFYAQRLAEAGWSPGDSAVREALTKLPPLEKRDLQERLDDVATAPRWEGVRYLTSNTGGTTGRPTTFYVDYDARDRRVAGTLRDQTWLGLRPGDPIAYLGGSSLGVPRSAGLMERAKFLAKGQLFLSAWDLSDRALAGYADRIEAFRPKLLVGYAGALHTLASYLDRVSRTVRVGCVQATAEMLFDAWRPVIERAFAAPVYERYGTREVGDIAHSCARCGAMHVNDENLLLETHPETNEVFVTDLTNFATPFVRYRLGDGAELGPGDPGCRPGLTVLRSLQGRTMDVLETAGGGRVSAVILVHSLKDFPEIRGHQLWQPAPDRIQLLVQTDERPPADSIRKALEPHFPGVALEIIWVDEIPTSDSGKLRFVMPNSEYSGGGVLV
jgi:phenylacetate-CoA ligase